VFGAKTDDEIVINAATGGRTTYKNAGKTRRWGVELMYDGDLGQGFTAHAAYTYLRAWFASDVVTGQPPAIVPAGNRLPGVPAQTAYGELAWTPAPLPWLSLAAELQYVAQIYVNDRNSEAAPAYTVANLRASVERRVGNWNLRAFARINNVADVNYVGSVIVGDTNGRYYEPAPGRNYFAGFTANVGF
jgi:iron complex outermembrane receptor protein